MNKKSFPLVKESIPGIFETSRYSDENTIDDFIDNFIRN
jgi:hypothetical protein